MRNVSCGIIICFVLLISSSSYPWGLTGHRIVGEEAQRHLTKRAAQVCDALLKGMSLSDEANFLDEERVEPKFGPVAPLHYVTVDDQYDSYENSAKNPAGDVVQAITVVFKYLKTGDAGALNALPILGELIKDKGSAITFLVHFVGDIHQPLHVGKSTDRGGNSVPVNYMGQITNLHSVWDEQMIDGNKYSFTEYANYLEDILKQITPAQRKAWENVDFAKWADESLAIRRSSVYNFPDDQPTPIPGQPLPLPVLGYKYMEANKYFLEQQLLKAGVRLAYLLNLIFESKHGGP